MPSTSIIIPSYNRAELVGEAIESCLAQDVSALQIIVVDDGSTDNTEDVVHAYPSVELLKLKRNQGVQKARNMGLSAAYGEHVKFLDSDDRLLPASLQNELNVADETAADVVVSGWHSAELQGCVTEHPAKRFADGEGIIDQILQGWAVHTSAALYRRGYLTANRLCWNETITKFQDWDFFAQAALSLGSVETWDGFSYVAQAHTGQQVSDVSLVENALAHHRILARLEHRVSEIGALNESRKKLLALYYFKELQVLSRYDEQAFELALKNISRLAPGLDPRDGIKNTQLGWLARIIGIKPALRLYARFKRG